MTDFDAATEEGSPPSQTDHSTIQRDSLDQGFQQGQTAPGSDEIAQSAPPPESVAITDPEDVVPHGSDEPSPVTPPDDAITERAALRGRLVRQFEAWLDEMLVEEPPPRGIPDSILELATQQAAASPAQGMESDLYGVFSALTTLSGEVRLQGRAFKQLSDTLATVPELPTLLRQAQAAQERSAADLLDALAAAAPEPDADALNASTSQIAELLIDLHDRLDRGVRAAAQAIEFIQRPDRRGWAWRVAGGPVVVEQATRPAEGLRDAAALALGRLQSSMQEWGIRPIGKVGESFDPERMTAVDVRAVEGVADGTVVDVIRSGYFLNGGLKAIARVAVARAKSAN